MKTIALVLLTVANIAMLAYASMNIVKDEKFSVVCDYPATTIITATVVEQERAPGRRADFGQMCQR